MQNLTVGAPRISTSSRRRQLRLLAAGGLLLVASWMGACEAADLGGLPPPGPDAISVVVDSTPPGASLSIDGVPMGAGPVTVKLNPGRHRLKGLKSGYFTAEQQITVSSGDAEQRVSLTLVSSH